MLDYRKMDKLSRKQSQNLEILYEDPDIVAVNKPAGLVVHSDGRTDEPALTDWVIEHYPKTKNVGEALTDKEGKAIARPGIVHRLDRGTSGVILIAKTKKGHAHLKEQFQNRTLGKKYLTFVHGDMKETYGIINRPIGKSPSDFRRFSATRGAKGEMREAETWWTMFAFRSGFSLIEAEPKTGRTHQIRVHFNAVNHPVVSDPLYGGGKPAALGFKRTALHAYSISFTNCKGKEITVKAPLPQDFLTAFEELHITDIAKKKGLC